MILKTEKCVIFGLIGLTLSFFQVENKLDLLLEIGVT